MAKEKKVAYKEPANYIPDEIQRKFKVGKYYEPTEDSGNAENRAVNEKIRDYVKNGK